MNNDIVDVVAKNIKSIRLQKKLSQEELASIAGLHRTYISLLERRRKNVSIKILQKIADALKVDITSLMK